MNTAAANVMSASAVSPPTRNRIRKTSAFLRKLSLNAEKNWVQNSGAKRRVSSKDEDMAIALQSVESGLARPSFRRPKRRYFWPKNNRSLRHASIAATRNQQLLPILTKNDGPNTVPRQPAKSAGVARRTRQPR